MRPLYRVEQQELPHQVQEFDLLVQVEVVRVLMVVARLRADLLFRQGVVLVVPRVARLDLELVQVLLRVDLMVVPVLFQVPGRLEVLVVAVGLSRDLHLEVALDPVVGFAPVLEEVDSL